jgi:hypothetical protein
MKTSRIVLLAAAAGAVLGAGISWANFGNTPPFLDEDLASAPLKVVAGKHPKVVVNHRAHDFGAVDRDAKAVHSFEITNVGDAPLKLEAGRTTCTRCTIATLTKPEVAPGETAEVTVEYLPSAEKPRFRQTAVVLTNDPEQPRIELDIFGRVTTRYELVPIDFSLSKVSVVQPKSVEVSLITAWADKIEVVGHEFLEPESADHFEFASEPLSPGELTMQKARDGRRLRVTVKPGLPLGQIQQTIRLELAIAGSPENAFVEVPVYGQVVSDISIVNRDWYAHLNQLRLGIVNSAAGTKRQLLVMVRGPHRDQVSLEPVEIDPPWVNVSVGEATTLNTKGAAEGGVTQIPLTIEIPPGAPPANHLGSDQGKLGEVILKTGHPEVKQLRINLHFAVEK